MRLRTRLRQLEQRLGRQECPGCGWGDPTRVQLRCHWPHESSTESASWVCSTCGRTYPIRITLEWPEELGDGDVEKC